MFTSTFLVTGGALLSAILFVAVSESGHAFSRRSYKQNNLVDVGELNPPQTIDPYELAWRRNLVNAMGTLDVLGTLRQRPDGYVMDTGRFVNNWSPREKAKIQYENARALARIQDDLMNDLMRRMMRKLENIKKKM